MTRGKLVPVAIETKLHNGDKESGLSCPACGAMVIHSADGSCGVCGKLLREGFQPLDAIRSSHRMQRVRLNMPDVVPADSIGLFEEHRTLVSNTAWACTVYSMVPYIGIVFIPPALLTGGFSYFRARRRNLAEEERQALICIGVSFVVLSIQLVLWWLLYLIPEIGI